MRPLRARDLPEMWRLHSDPRVFLLDSIPPLTAVDHMERVLGMWLLDQSGTSLGYQLVSHVDGHALGVAGLSRMSLGERSVANTYVRFYPEAWGHGYARRAIEECLDDLGEILNADASSPEPREAVFITATRNTPAKRLAERIGYRLTTEQDETDPSPHVVYSLDVEQWWEARNS